MTKLLVLIGIFCSSCRQDISSKMIIKDINKKPEVYSELISEIKESDSIKFNGTLVNINNVPNNIVKALEKTVLSKRFKYISVDKLSCGDKSIEIIVDNYHLNYSACPDSNFPKPNSYDQTGFIEVWGINKNWYLLKDNDPI